MADTESTAARKCQKHGEHDEWAPRKFRSGNVGQICLRCRRERDRKRRNGRTDRVLGIGGKVCTKHGEHDDWGYRKPFGNRANGWWQCRPCDRDRQHRAEQKPWRKAAREKAKPPNEGVVQEAEGGGVPP